MGAVWSWITAHPGAVGWIALGVAVLYIALRVWRARVGALKDKLAVSKAKVDVAKLEERRDALRDKATDLGFADAKLAQAEKNLEKEIADKKRAVVEARESVEGKDDAEVAARFNNLFP